jgi:hypothetical protein
VISIAIVAWIILYAISVQIVTRNNGTTRSSRIIPFDQNVQISAGEFTVEKVGRYDVINLLLIGRHIAIIYPNPHWRHVKSSPLPHLANWYQPRFPLLTRTLQQMAGMGLDDHPDLSAGSKAQRVASTQRKVHR